MAIERKFISEAFARYMVSSYLKRKLERVGFSDVTISRAPTVTRITITAAAPGRLIGRKGRSITSFTDLIAARFGLGSTQVAVLPVEVFELEPRLMAYAIAKRIEAGRPIRPTIHAALKRIIAAGAQGAEIRVSGKIVPKGGKAKAMRVAHGFLPKAGELTKFVRAAHFVARPKYGTINVRVAILPPGVVLPGKVGAVAVPKEIRYAEEKRIEMESGREEESLPT